MRAYCRCTSGHYFMGVFCQLDGWSAAASRELAEATDLLRQRGEELSLVSLRSAGVSESSLERGIVVQFGSPASAFEAVAPAAYSVDGEWRPPDELGAGRRRELTPLSDLRLPLVVCLPGAHRSRQWSARPPDGATAYPGAAAPLPWVEPVLVAARARGNDGEAWFTVGAALYVAAFCLAGWSMMRAQRAYLDLYRARASRERVSDADLALRTFRLLATPQADPELEAARRRVRARVGFVLATMILGFPVPFLLGYLA